MRHTAIGAEGGPGVNFDGVRHAREHVLRPRGHVLRHSAIAALALCAPIFSVLYWLTVPIGAWIPVAAAQVVLTLLCALALIAYLRTGIWVDHSGITERGFFGRVDSFTTAKVGSILLLELYLGDALDTNTHLFVTGTDGRLLVRMRGQFYSRSSMDIVIEQLAAPVVRVDEPMTLRELNRARPELLYWFERRLVDRPA